MRPAQLRGWIKKYGMGGLLLAGSYLGWHHLSTKQRAALFAGVLAIVLLSVIVLFRHRQVSSIPRYASHLPTVDETGVNQYLELRRNMTLARIVSGTDTNAWRVKVARQKEPFEVTIEDRTDFYKQGKIVSPDAFHRGDQVYIVPHIMAETDMPTQAIAITDEFTDAAKALEQVSRVVHATVTDTQTVGGRIWLKTQDGQTLQVYIYPMLGEPALLGGKMPPYYVTWQILNQRIRARLLHLSSDGTADLLDASPEPPPGTSAMTPLMVAASQGDIATVRRLLAQGTPVNARNYRGESALLLATASTEGNPTDMVQLLVSRGAQINVADNLGWTPLLCAASQGNLPIVRLLLAHGADVHAKLFGGDTAPMLAESNGHPEIAQILREYSTGK